MDESLHESAERVRSLIERGALAPALFRAALESIPPAARDVWVDRVFGLDAIPEDSPDLPPGCVPYLPCSIDALLRVATDAPVRAPDVFVDIGSGVGRAAAVVHLLTGARAVGVEIQPPLVAAARALVARLNLSDVSFVEADAEQLPDACAAGSVFLLYCPFSGDRFAKVLARLRTVASARVLRICCVDLPLPPCPWLQQTPPLSGDLAIYRSTLVD